MKIFAALREDTQQGWVWIQDNNIPIRSIVKITNSDTQKTIYCEALQIDKNFLTAYNQTPRIPINNPQNSIVINGWYRAALGDLKTQSEVALTIKPFNCLWGKFNACTGHPQTIIRVAAWLGLTSAILGLIGILLGMISFF